MRRVWVFLSVYVLWATFSLADAAIRVACVGDSITEGYGIRNKARDGYPSQLADLFGTEWEVRNFGVSSSTLMNAGDKPYQKQRACAAALEWKPDIVVIALGTNDSKDINIGQHPEDFIPSYKDLLERFRAANSRVRILICLPPPAFPEGMGIREAVLAEAIRPRVRSVAKDEQLPIIDLKQRLSAYALHFPDKIHPDSDAAGVIATSVYAAVMAITQPVAKATDPESNTAIRPVPKLEQDSYDWWQRHAEVLQTQKRMKPEVVLIGDSITHFWGGEPASVQPRGAEAWTNTFGPGQALNMGFGWDRTQNVLWRLDHGELDGLNPKLVVVNIGTNNFSATPNARRNTPQEVAQGILTICERVRQKAPNSRILVMGVFPRGANPTDQFRKEISDLNTILAEKTKVQKLEFLDIGSRFFEREGRDSS